MKNKIIVSGVGCCLVDLLYNNIDFNSSKMATFFSKDSGDGGLCPGKLVLQEDFEKFSHTTIDNFIKTIVDDQCPDKISIGGPSIVSLIHAAQITYSQNCEIHFVGKAGNDDYGKFLKKHLAKTPVILKDFKLIDKERTPSTVVLSDPSYDNGHGERMFINTIGAAWHMKPEDLEDDFFRSDIVVFGGTALVPNIHNNLFSLLRKAKKNGCITLVNTVYDFIHEKESPAEKWPLGESNKTYSYIDILITDKEEAKRLSGSESIDSALDFFIKKNSKTVIITNGVEDIGIYSDGSIFNTKGTFFIPVSEKIRTELKTLKTGDTTGCGDNFVGGFIGSLINQIASENTQLDLKEALSWAVVSGGFNCFYVGGTYFESFPGKKLSRIKPYYDAYKKQISNQLE